MSGEYWIEVEIGGLIDDGLGERGWWFGFRGDGDSCIDFGWSVKVESIGFVGSLDVV